MHCDTEAIKQPLLSTTVSKVERSQTVCETPIFSPFLSMGHSLFKIELISERIMMMTVEDPRTLLVLKINELFINGKMVSIINVTFIIISEWIIIHTDTPS